MEFWINDAAVQAVCALAAVVVVARACVRIFARKGNDA